MTREEAVRMIVGKIRDHEENGHCAFFDEDDEIEALCMALYALRDNPPIDKVLEIIDTAQTYKMYPGEEDTYIDKSVIREAVKALMEVEE